MTFTEDDLNTYRKFSRSFSFFVRFARRTMRRDRGTCRQLLREPPTLTSGPPHFLDPYDAHTGCLQGPPTVRVRSMSCFPNPFDSLLKSRNGHTDKWSPSVTIGDLPEEVLLEIFNCYGQTFQNDSQHERIWNSNQGWFKLAHVC